MQVPYYGRQLDDDRLVGGLGRVVRVLNRARAFLQRQAEVFTALALADEQGRNLTDVVDTVIDEGLTQPTPILSRGPVEPAERPDDTGITGRFYERRSYEESSGRSVPKADRLGNLIARYGSRAGKRYGTPIVIREVFEAVEKSK